MRKIKDLLRLKFEQRLSHRQIAASLGIALSSVHEFLQRAANAQVTWPLSEAISQSELERRLFPSKRVLPAEDLALPDWKSIDRELTKKGVTLLLLWEEYRRREAAATERLRSLCRYRRLMSPIRLLQAT